MAHALHQKCTLALLILERIGKVQGERTQAVLHDSPGSSVSSSVLDTRKLLNNLCSACNSRKGGDSTNSIGLENRNEKPVYWVGSNLELDRVNEFLRKILTKVAGAGTVTRTGARQEALQDDLFDMISRHSHERLLNARKDLMTAIRHEQDYINSAPIVNANREGTCLSLVPLSSTELNAS